MKTVTVTGTFDPNSTRTIVLVPGRNTGTREYPCPECKTATSQHFTFCRHYLLQQQYRLDRDHQTRCEFADHEIR